MSTLAVVLAAGEGRRFGGSKLRAELRGRPLVCWALDAAEAAGLDETAVVTGADDLADLLEPTLVRLPNPAWATGQASSLQVAVAHAEAEGHEALVVGLADTPFVPAEAWQAVSEVEAPIVTAEFDGDRRPPVRLARAVWPLLPIEGDEGARALLRRRPDLVTAVPCAGVPADVDTRGDLERWS